MNEGAVQPLDVVVLRERQQDLVADDGEGQEQDRPGRHCERERAQRQRNPVDYGIFIFLFI